jgi:hypothetical protein
VRTGLDLRAPGRGERTERPSSPFEAKALPEAERLRLCEDLLSEFGVSRIRKNPRKHELIHSCPIPGAHANGDRNPSAALNYQDLVFRCLGCGAYGGLLWFVATCRQDDSAGARDWLNGATGLGGQEMDLTTLLGIIDAAYAKHSAREPIPRYNPATLAPWTRWAEPYPLLTEPPRRSDPPGFKGRGIPAETLREFQVGYAPDYEMRVGRQVITQERIIIPHFWRGELCGWQARKVDPADEPKYKNTPEFPKDRTLYNHHPRARSVVVVESPMSVLRHVHHVPQLEATFGTLTPDQIKLLAGFDDVVLWFDNDDAGWEDTRQAIEGLKAHTSVRVVDSPYDADVADMDDDTVAQLLQNAVPWPLWSPPSELTPWED